LITIVHSVDYIGIEVELLQQVINESLPGRQPYRHRDTCAHKQDRVTPLDGVGQDISGRYFSLLYTCL
jgi:hypothetical protein